MILFLQKLKAILYVFPSYKCIMKMHRIKRIPHIDNVATFGKTLGLVENLVKNFNILSILICFKRNVLIWNYILI